MLLIGFWRLCLNDVVSPCAIEIEPDSLFEYLTHRVSIKFIISYVSVFSFLESFSPHPISIIVGEILENCQ